MLKFVGTGGTEWLVDLQQQLGESQAAVCRGHSAESDESVAVKVLNWSSLASAGKVQARREIAAGARLRDIGAVVSCMDFGVATITGAELLCLVYPQAEAALSEAIEGTQTGTDLAWSVLSDIAPALVAIQELGVVHRDIAPDNIMMHRGQWKLIDFGLARLLDVSTATQTLQRWGKRYYLPPEAGGTPTEKYDVYQLGRVALACATGEPDATVEGLSDPALSLLIRKMMRGDPNSRIDAASIVDQTSHIVQREQLSESNAMREVWERRLVLRTAEAKKDLAAEAENERLAADLAAAEEMLGMRRQLVASLINDVAGELAQFEPDSLVEHVEHESVAKWTAADFHVEIHATIETLNQEDLYLDAIADVYVAPTAERIDHDAPIAQLIARQPSGDWLRVSPSCPCKRCFIRRPHLGVVQNYPRDRLDKRYSPREFSMTDLARWIAQGMR